MKWNLLSAYLLLFFSTFGVFCNMQSKGNVLLSLIFFHLFYFFSLRKKKKRQYIWLVSPKSQLLLWVYLVPHSEVNDLEISVQPPAFLPHTRPYLTHQWLLQRCISGSLKNQGHFTWSFPLSSHGKRTSVTVANVIETLHHSKGSDVLTSKLR